MPQPDKKDLPLYNLNDNDFSQYVYAVNHKPCRRIHAELLKLAPFCNQNEDDPVCTRVTMLYFGCLLNFMDRDSRNCLKNYAIDPEYNVFDVEMCQKLSFHVADELIHLAERFKLINPKDTIDHLKNNPVSFFRKEYQQCSNTYITECHTERFLYESKLRLEKCSKEIEATKGNDPNENYEFTRLQYGNVLDVFGNQTSEAMKNLGQCFQSVTKDYFGDSL